MSKPLLLKSNIIPGSNLGALPNMYRAETGVRRDPTVENQDGTFTIPTYQRTQIDIPDDFDWSMYGTKYAPMLRYFDKVRTGEIIYDPEDDRIDKELLGEGTDGDGPPLTTEAEMIKQSLIAFGTDLAAGAGAQIGRAAAADMDGGLSGATSDYFGQKNKMNLIFSPEKGPTAKIYDSPGTKRANLAARGPELTGGQRSAYNSRKNDLARIIKEPGTGSRADLEAKINAENELESINQRLSPVTGTGETGYLSGFQDRSGFRTIKNPDGTSNMSAAGRANVFGSLGAGGATVAANLIAGRNLKDSVKSGAEVAAGSYVGSLLIPGPFGGFIGSTIASLFGGSRVICNELMRQGIMTRKQVVMDYKFTEDYLTPQHVSGYHVWAVWMVRQMRKGRLVNFWKHVAGHRANEIAYIYGERDKPDYLGKVYRKVLEPICWSIGFFCQKTDWTVLYKEKEI